MYIIFLYHITFHACTSYGVCKVCVCKYICRVMGILPTFVKSKVYAVIVVNTGDKMNVELKCLDMFNSLCTTLGFKTMQKQL